ncbi:MAG TPA: DNA gyrase/topoisomerase IV subunit A [Bacteroidales bacterium]|nr:DNA gyrase/topoisomerase IV subunit A [Bacteroidales bacterium]
MSDDLDNIPDPEELENLPDETSAEAAPGSHFQDKVIHTTVLGGMYKDWFLDYASYVILERAVPHINDGLKPVQRRIFHSMRRLDDGRFNKVANIIGHTMQFHPHGDASIGEALVQLGQKELAVECQGNWGNIFTGDSAAAPRYIEARLSKFAMEVIFNPKTTEWKLSYDGRNKEPVTLPVKFPLLLAQGVEGIAVGLASKILPHNFNELLDASIAVLKNEPFTLYPDFPTGGLADISKYNDGLRGGVVKVRAKINKLDKKTLVINDIPFGKTTSTLIDSILKANDKGKIKIRKIDDNTAEKVEIIVHLQPGVSPDVTIDALYAFTDCEISISPNSCVIDNDKPRFIGVSEILRANTYRTLELLRQELNIRMAELLEDWHLSSLEKIFFEEKIYRELEKETESWELTIDAIDKAFNPFRPRFKREITREDLLKLTEKPVRRISRFDIKKADELIKGLEKEMEQVQYDLDNIVTYTINWFKNLKKKYGADKQRLTELRSFESIEATAVIANNEKLYINRADGFIGTNLKKDEFVCDCSDIDDILVIRRDGTYLTTKVAEKTFVGKDILHVSVFKKNDTRTIFNIIYFDGESGFSYVKRCAINGLTRDKEYNLTQGTPYSKILYLTVNPNGEAETVKVKLKPRPRLKVLDLIFNFAELAVKGRGAIGNILTKHAIHKIELKEKGISTIGGTAIWFDNDTFRLNTDERGTYLGQFIGNDKILVLNQKGEFYTTSYELTNHFDDDIVFIEKYTPDKVFSIVYFDAEQQFYYVKRCTFEMSERPQNFIDDNPKSKLILLSTEFFPQFKIDFGGKHKNRPAEIIDVEQFIGVKSFRAKGRRLTTFEVKTVAEIEPLQKEIPVKPDESQELQSGIADIKEEDIFKNTSSGKPIEPSLF